MRIIEEPWHAQQEVGAIGLRQVSLGRQQPPSQTRQAGPSANANLEACIFRKAAISSRSGFQQVAIGCEGRLNPNRYNSSLSGLRDRR